MKNIMWENYLSTNYRNTLVKGIEQLALVDDISSEKITALLVYHQLLIKWNKVYNLTSIRDPEEMILLHFLDCLVISPYLQGDRFIDIGTGAGLPGIILAIIYPQRQFAVLDSNG